jgi:hypothetical protein
MSEWYDIQKKPSSNLRLLIKGRLDKANPRRKLAKDETTKLAKLEGIVEKLRRGENVQNRQLQTWLSEDEYAQVDIEWQEQLELREELTLIKRRCVMKSYDELKAEMETIQQQMAEAKKNERTNALKEVKRLCKEFGFTAGMLKGSLAEGRKKS